jgi:zinc protease
MFRITSKTIAVLLALAAAGCSSSAPPPATATSDPNALPKIEFEKYTLPNGLDVILSEDHRLPMVAVDVWYHVGPANEAAGRTGFAHLFEHMMFQGSKHASGEFFNRVEAAGGTNLNGTTNLDRTNYFETLPANQLDLGLWLESDRMGYLLDTLDEQQLANQRDVVRGERRQSIENVPYGMVNEALFHNVYPKGHPYYANVIGSHADIQAAKLDDVKAFFKQYYTPNNASLAIVGDFDKAKTKQLVEKYFGPLKRGPAVTKAAVPQPVLTGAKKVVVQDRVQLPRVYMAWMTPAFFKPGDADADAAASAIGGGNSSRLYKKLVYEKQIAQDVVAFQYSMGLGSMFQINATVRPGHTPDEVQAAIDAELETFRQQGPDEKEVERARNTFETTMVTGLETLGGFGGVADTLNMFNHYVGDPGHLPKYIDEHRKVTPATVKAFAQQYLKADARVIVYGVPGQTDFGPQVATPPMPKTAPGTGAESVNADEPWRATQPKPSGSLSITLPTPASFTLPNGLTVIYKVRPGLPVAAASLEVRSGGDSNPIDRPGLASFTASMLDQGTASRDAPKIADDLAQIGAAFQANSSKDAIVSSVGSLSKNFPAALELLADMTLRTSFPQAEVERQRASRLASLVQARQDPTTLASMAAVKALFGDKHPYGYIELGDEAGNKAASRDDLVAFWTKNFVPSNAALVIAGGLNEADIRPMVEKTFGAWKGGPAPTVTLGAPSTTSERLVVVNTPGAPATELMVTTIGPARSTPDYAATNVMNAVLGGLFSSRINLNLREQHGYTYGAGSQFIYRKMPGPFWVQTSVRNDVAVAATNEIFKELHRMVETPMSAEELGMAKDFIVASLPADFETSVSTVASLGGLYVYSLGLDYYSKYPGQISAVTAESAQAAAKKYLDPSKMIVVAVGDKAKVEAGLKTVKR